MTKGILHGHRVLASYRPSINLFFNLSMKDKNAVYWSPSDWAWVGGLLDMLFPAWMAGKPIATSEDRFNADWAYKFIERHKVTHTFLAPTAIKRMAQVQNPKLEELLWTIAVARLILPSSINIQVPPNLNDGVLPQLIAAGINDWGGVSPVTPDDKLLSK